jgi:hypothetical protein
MIHPFFLLNSRGTEFFIFRMSFSETTPPLKMEDKKMQLCPMLFSSDASDEFYGFGQLMNKTSVPINYDVSKNHVVVKILADFADALSTAKKAFEESIAAQNFATFEVTWVNYLPHVSWTENKS